MKKFLSWKTLKRKLLLCALMVTTVSLLIGTSILTEMNSNFAMAASTVSINLINYGSHSTTIDNTIVSAHPAFMVDNSPAGPWKGTAKISTFTSAGIMYFEYLDGGYEGTEAQSIPNDLNSNLNYIAAAAQAGASGIFLDEVSSNPSSTSTSYLSQIAAKAHSLGLKVVFNVGVDSWSDSLMNYCDYINSSEVWNNGSLTSSQTKWANRTWLLTQGVNDATSAANLTKEAWSKGILAEYACTSYGAIPSWFSTYVSLISTSSPTPTSSPATTTGSATALTTNSATLNGTLTSTGSTIPAQVSFDWGATTSYGNTTASQAASATGAFSAGISGLSPNTIYHFRIKATGNGTAYGNDVTFVTSNASTTSPAITTGSATALTTNSATLNGSLTSLGSSSSVIVSFDWGLTSSYGNTTTSQTMTAANTFTATLTGLAANTTYHFRAKLSNGTLYGNDGTFTTSPNSITPTTTGNTTGTVANTPASSGGGNEYNFYLKVTSTTVSGITVSQQVWCAATTTDFPNLLTVGSTITGNLDHSLGWWIIKKASSSTTTSTSPAITTGSATALTTNSATLNGSLTSLGSSSSVIVSFDWGLTSSYGNTTTSQTMTAANTFTATLTGLAANTTYHFRAKLSNGTLYGNDGTFTTSPNSITPTTTGNTTGTVANTPASSGGGNEYNFYLKVTSTTVSGITVSQQVWCAATTTDFPNLLTVGSTITGNLDHSLGWWVLTK